MPEKISLGSFVLVKVCGKKTWKPYVAQVSALDETEINVVFLKQISLLNFIYPENDTGVIQHDHRRQLLKKLGEASFYRAIFNNDD